MKRKQIRLKSQTLIIKSCAECPIQQDDLGLITCGLGAGLYIGGDDPTGKICWADCLLEDAQVRTTLTEMVQERHGEKNGRG